MASAGRSVTAAGGGRRAAELACLRSAVHIRGRWPRAVGGGRWAVGCGLALPSVRCVLCAGAIATCFCSAAGVACEPATLARLLGRDKGGLRLWRRHDWPGQRVSCCRFFYGSGLRRRRPVTRPRRFWRPLAPFGRRAGRSCSCAAPACAARSSWRRRAAAIGQPSLARAALRCFLPPAFLSPGSRARSCRPRDAPGVERDFRQDAMR